MNKSRLAVVATLAAALVGMSQPSIAGSDPASDYARSVCLSNGWKALGYSTYLECYNYFYQVHGTPDQPEDPFG
ncbi:hypothetical protein [Sphingomonas sp. M1A8_2b]